MTILALSGCSGGTSPPDAGPGDPLTWAVDKKGPYSVGYHLLSTTYTPPGGLAPRTIEVHLWYPTNNPTGENPSYRPLGPDADAFTDAPPAPSPFGAGGYPVLVHSHGYKAWPGANAHIARYIASHGWAVIEPQHLGNTLFDTPATLPLAIYIERPTDVTAALDLAAHLPATDLLAGKIDLSRVAMSGHSFGTYTAAVVAGTRVDEKVIRDACQKGNYANCTDAQITALTGDLSEPRARVILPLAGGKAGEFGANPYNPRGVPVLSMVGTLNQGGETDLFNAVTSPDYTYIQIMGGCHELFDLGNTAAGDMGADTSSGLHCYNLSDADGFAIVNPLLLAYLRYHIISDRGAEVSGIVAGTKQISPREIFMHK